MPFWLGVSVRVGVKFRLGLTLSLKLALIILHLNLTYFGVRSVTSDVIVTGEKYAKVYLLYEHVFDEQSCQIKRE